MSDKSKCDRVFRSNAKTSISNASFHSFNSRSDGLRYDFSTNKLKISMSNTSFRNFRRSFASPVLEKSRFFLLRPNFRPYTRGPLGCLLGFWPSGPKPCGGNNSETIYVVVQFYPWFKILFPLFQTHYHQITITKTKEIKF